MICHKVCPPGSFSPFESKVFLDDHCLIEPVFSLFFWGGGGICRIGIGVKGRFVAFSTQTVSRSCDHGHISSSFDKMKVTTRGQKRNGLTEET